MCISLNVTRVAGVFWVQYSFVFLSDPDFGFLYFFGVSMCGVVAAYFSIGVRAMVSLPTLAPQVAVSIPGSKV